MNNKTQNLTTGNLFTQILFFSLPLIASNLLQVLFNLADVSVVGRFAGDIPLGAVGSTTTLVYIYVGILMGMSIGTNILTAHSIGVGRKDVYDKTIHTALIINLVEGIILFVIGQLTSEFVLNLLGTKEEFLSGAMLYMRIYFIGLPAQAIYNYGNAVYSAHGNTRKPLVFLSIAGILNIILNLFFVIVCHMAEAGVAAASVISLYVSAICILISFMTKDSRIKLSIKKLKYDKTIGAGILRLGISSGIQNAIFQIANLFIQGSVNTFPYIVVAGNSAAQNADSLVYDVMAAFYTACNSFMGQNYGAGNKKRVTMTYFISLGYALVIGIIMGFTLVLFGNEFLSIFTTNSDVINAGMQRLKIMGICYGFSAFMDCTIAASRSMGKSLVPTVIVIMGSCVFRIIWVYSIFAHFHTLPSLYLLYIFSWTITSVAEIIYFIHIYRHAWSYAPKH